MHFPLAWIVPIAVAILYVSWGLWFQTRDPEAGGEQ